jgi:Gluconate 2-dehydrogenase subunit 3
MKRRQAIRSLLSLPAITALPAMAQQAAIDKTKPPAQERLPAEIKPAPVEETPKLAMTTADAAVPGALRFFSDAQIGTLRHLSDVLIPAVNGRPGAIDAGVPEFLDFLISESPHDRQTLYKSGLDRLESESQRRFHSSFTNITPQQATELLAPLHEKWSHQGPSDPFGRFLRAAKDDVLQATVASREWAASATQRRGAGGVGSYWYSME